MSLNTTISKNTWRKDLKIPQKNSELCKKKLIKKDEKNKRYELSLIHTQILSNNT